MFPATNVFGVSIQFHRKTLGEVIEFKRGYDLPSQDRLIGDFPIISSSGKTGSHLSHKVEGPGVITGRYGTLGEIFYEKNDFWPLNTTLYVKDFKGNDPKFIYYFLKTLDFWSFSDKAAVPGLNRNDLHTAEILFPTDTRYQKSIASILGALDDKIDLNRRTNETLEAMARALFRDWFVDFGPTRAKMAGQAPYLAPEIWELFPDRLDDEGKPEGWLNGTLESVTNLQNGYAFKSSDWLSAGIPVIKIGAVKPSVVDLNNLSFVSSRFLVEKPNFILNSGDILIGLTGYVGEVGRLPPYTPSPLLNQRGGIEELFVDALV